MVKYLHCSNLILAIVVTFVANSTAQTIYVTDQNIFDLNPSRDAISGLAGAQRIKASFWEDSSYTIPLDVSAALPITLTISSTVDDYQVTVLNSATSTPPNVVWWVVPFLNAGTYRAQATAVFPDDQFGVFDRFLTLTNVPAAAAATFNITNNISADVNITNVTTVIGYSNTYYTTSGVSSVSFTGSVDGALTFEGNAVTQTGTTFNFSYDRAFVTNEYTTNSLSVYELLYGGASTNVATVNASGLKAQSGNNYWTYDNIGIRYNNSNVLYRFGPGFYALGQQTFPWKVLTDAASDTDIVNYRTATNLIATLAGGGGDGGFTNIVTEGSGNVVTNLTHGGSVITQQLGTITGGGGGGDVTIEGVTSNEFDFVFQYPIVGSNVGSTIYWGLVSLDGLVITPSITNFAVFNFVDYTNQSFVVPATVTQVYFYIWGGAGGGAAQGTGGPGGYTFAQAPVVGGETLSVIVGEGADGQGFINDGVYRTVGGGWPNGGSGACRGTYGAGGGGGYSGIWRGTNLLALSGGGGGTGYNVSGGSGGGVTGQDGFTPSNGESGGGGTQSSGGSTGDSSAYVMQITNTAGAAFSGGNGGIRYNIATQGAGGGGSGYYGGGGSYTSGNSGRAGGGGGSGYINTDAGLVGVTVRGGGTLPAGQDDALYGYPVGTSWGTATSINGNNGGIIIRWQ